MSRPRYHARRDDNDNFLAGLLTKMGYMYRGYPLRVWDTSPYGGEFTDRLIAHGPLMFWLEIKRPGHEDDLTEGERRTLASGIPGGVVVDEDGFLRLLDRYLPLVIALEGQTKSPR